MSPAPSCDVGRGDRDDDDEASEQGDRAQGRRGGVSVGTGVVVVADLVEVPLVVDGRVDEGRTGDSVTEELIGTVQRRETARRRPDPA